MNRWRSILLALIFAAALAPAARASVIYRFTAVSGSYTGGWEFTAPGYLAPDLYTGFPTSGVGIQLPVASLDSCSIVPNPPYSLPSQNLVCDRQAITRSASFTGGGTIYDIVFFSQRTASNPIGGSLAYYFEDGAFSKAGIYQTVLLGPSQAGMLEVIDTSDVPEPATWAMFIGGFGLIGRAMRARSGQAFEAA